MILIPSRRRPQMIAKTIPRMKDVTAEIVVFVEEEDYDEYSEIGEEIGGFYLVKLPHSNRGVAYARNQMLHWTHYEFPRVQSIAMMDDDVVVEGIDGLIQFVDWNPEVGGCAGYFPIYKSFANLDPDQGPVLHTGTLGQVCYALRINNVLSVGGWDERLQRKEDYDLRINLLKAGMPWYIHTDVPIKPIGKQYGEGGIQSLGLDHEAVERKAYEVLVEKHGDQFIKWQNSGKTNIRVLWKKMSEYYGC